MYTMTKILFFVIRHVQLFVHDYIILKHFELSKNERNNENIGYTLYECFCVLYIHYIE